MSSSLKVPLPEKTRLPKDDPISREPISDQTGTSSDSELRLLNVEQRLALLRQQFAPGDPVKPEEDVSVQPWNLKSLSQNLLVRRSIKSAAALALAGLVVWLPVQRLFQTTSVEAIVNARTLTLRAPIDGIVSVAPTSLAVGATFKADTPCCVSQTAGLTEHGLMIFAGWKSTLRLRLRH